MMRAGVYIQVPFCQTKCTYCNFHTGVVSTARFAPYVEAVCREIREHRELLSAAGVEWPVPFRRSSAAPLQKGGGTANEEVEVDTAYIGGGTPSLLDPAHLQDLLDAIRLAFGQRPVSEGGPYRTEFEEVTLEADPETIEAGKAQAWARAGINRVSFGLQSFSDKELIAAGRMHRRADIYRAAPILREAGIRNISFDLIAGLPHQTRESWENSLQELERMTPEHVSVYLLEIDEGSRLGREVLQGGARYSAGALPSEDEMVDFYEMAQDGLRRMGYHHYEISNWAKPGLESKHNLKYWRREPYLGFGAGAHSFSGTERWANAHDAATYVNALQSGRLPVEQHERVTKEQALEEEFFLGLRQLDGIDLARIEQEYGVKLSARFDSPALAGLIEREGSVVRLAPGRLSISNEVFAELLR